MLTLTLLLASLLALDATTAPKGRLRTDASALKADIKVVSPWCRGRPRVQLKLENTSQTTIWLALEHSPKQPIEWIHYWYLDDRGGGEGSGGAEDGDFLQFLRSGESTKLDPGKSGTWLLELGPMKLHAGEARVGVRGPVFGSTSLDEDRITLYEFRAEISVKLKKMGRCYNFGGG